MRKQQAFLFVLMFFSASGVFAQEVAKSFMKVGNGGTLVNVLEQTVTYNVLSVGPISPPADAVCVITASVNVSLSTDDFIVMELCDGETCTGVTEYEILDPNSSVVLRNSTIVEAFNVPAGSGKTFDLNARSLGVASGTQLLGTRIWASCSFGTLSE